MTLLEQLRTIEWGFPFVTQVIQAIVLTLVFLILTVLAGTVGIAIQIGGVFHVLLLDATSKFKVGGFAERSAYAICAGIYLILFIPFWLVQLPFSTLGWFWTVSRSLALALAVGIVILCAYLYLHPSVVTSLRHTFEPYLRELKVEQDGGGQPATRSELE